MRRWLRHLRQLRKIERAERTAYLRWRRTAHEKSDVVIVHGCLSPLYDDVSRRWDETYREYTDLRLQRERLEECGPA